MCFMKLRGCRCDDYIGLRAGAVGAVRDDIWGWVELILVVSVCRGVLRQRIDLALNEHAFCDGEKGSVCHWS
jgi:hypothetical protein